MKLNIRTLAAAALLTASVPALSSPAEARGFGFHGGFGHVGGWGGGWGHGGWGHGGWGGVGLGLATGALIGAALATPYYDYGYSGYPYAYDNEYPVAYDYGYPVAYDYGYAPAYTVGYVGPYWGYRHRYWAHRPYAYGLGFGGYRPRVAYTGYRTGFSHAAYRAYGRAGFAGGVHHGRFR